jgi:hypothetical protein
MIISPALVLSLVFFLMIICKPMERERFIELVKNTYRVLLTRGMKGCYVHFLPSITLDFDLKGSLPCPKTFASCSSSMDLPCLER